MVSSEERVESYKPRTKTKFLFYSGSGKKIAEIKNLSELITVMIDLDPYILHFHLSNDIRNDVFGTDGLPELNGPVIQTDLPLWLSHVLGESELASKVLDLTSKHANDSKTLKEKVIAICKKHEAIRRKKMLERSL
ncbi:MAG: DUF5752 family protein [Candidatus Odinarchaeota archaeon]